MRCPECATADLDADARFCGRCGALLRPTAGSQAPATIARPPEPDHRPDDPDEPTGGHGVPPPRGTGTGPRWLAAAVVLVLIAGLAVVVPRIVRDDTAPGLGSLDGERWRTALGTEPSFRFTNVSTVIDPSIDLAVAPDGVYVTAERTIAAYGRDHGDRRWQRVLPDPRYPTVAGPVLVVVASPGVVALDRETGQVRWEEPVAGDISVTTDGRDRVFVSRPGGVYAVSARDGRALWSVPIEGPPLPSVLVADARTLIAGYSDGAVRAFDGTTGRQRWHRARLGALLEAPALGDGTLYLESGAGELLAVDAPTGRDRWRVPLTGGPWGTLTAARDVVIRHAPDGTTTAFSADDGARRWSHPARTFTPPVVGERTLYLTRSSPPRILAVDARSGAIRWERRRSDVAPAAADGDEMFAVGGDVIASWDAHDGDERWQVSPSEPDRPPGYPTPVVTPDRVYVTTVGGPLVALDRGSGEEVWRFDPAVVEDELPTESPSGATSVALPLGERVVVASNRAVYSLDAASGRVHATFPTNVRPGAVPVLAGGVVVIDLGPSLVGLERDDLRLRWQYTTPTQGARIGAHPVTPPTVHGDVVLVGGGEGTLAALDPSTGAPVWDLDLGAAITSRPTVGDDVIVVRTGTGDVRAFDARSGRARWRHALSPTGISDPSIAGGTVHVADGRELIALDLETGTERWRTDPGGGRLSAPTSVDGAVYVGTAVGELVALSNAAGEIRWRFPVGAPVAAAPAVTDEELIAVTDDGAVVSLR